MNIGTARNLMLDQQRQAEFWTQQVERHRKEGSEVKVRMSLELALRHRQISDILLEWQDVKRKEER